MELFDERILDVRKFILRRKEEGTALREIQCSKSLKMLHDNLGARYSSSNRPTVLLRDDTFLELGHPGKGSTSLVLWSGHEELIRDGSITIIGRDIPESPGESLPFGQIILVGGSRLQSEDFATLQQTQSLGNYLQGYMVRQMQGRLWTRVSHNAGQSGLSFEIVGQALFARYRQRFPALEAIEIVFVTSSKSHVEELEEISERAKDSRLEIRGLKRTGQGTYECDNLSCEACPDKPACDTVREAVVVRKKKRGMDPEDAHKIAAAI